MYPRGPYSLLVQGTSTPYPAEHGVVMKMKMRRKIKILIFHHLHLKYKQAIESLEDIMMFLEQHGQIELASKATSLLPELATRHAATLCQTTLKPFL